MRILNVLTLFVVLLYSCESFSEHYAVTRPLTNGEKTLLVTGSDISAELRNIITIDFQKKGIIVLEYFSDEVRFYFENLLIARKPEVPLMSKLLPPLSGNNKNIFTAEHKDITMNEQDATGKEIRQYEELLTNHKDYAAFIKEVFDTAGADRIVYLRRKENSRVSIPAKGYYLSVYGYDRSNNMMSSDITYMVSSTGSKAWKNNFKVIYDRDINDSYVYENDFFIPYNKSVKRQYEFSRRITDLVTGSLR